MSNAQRHAGLSFLTLAACVVSLSLAVAQGTEEQTAACSGDAFTLCRGDIPDVAKITACMRAHEAQLSSKCRAVFEAGDHRNTPSPKIATAPKLAPKKTPEPKQASVTRTAKAPEHKTVAPKARTPRIAAKTAERPEKVRASVERKPRDTAIVVAPRPLAPATEQPAAVPSSPAPERFPGLASYRAGIVSSCAKGLIDPYTCRSSLDALKTLE